MDSITQALLGAGIQGALLGRWQGRKALLYGAALASVPDLDVVIDYGDAVAQMTYHRGFSHSLLVLSGLALALTLLLRRCFPQAPYSPQRLLLTLWLVLITHPLLDAFTSYGTQLFWPLPATPVAISSIFIIDPLYSVPLLLGVLVALWRGLAGRRSLALPLVLAISSGYLGLTVAGKLLAEQRVAQVLQRQGIQPEAMFSGPTPFNGLLWRVTVLDGERYHEALSGWFDRQPPHLLSLPRGTALRASLQDSPQHQRLQWFTHDVLRYDEVDGRLLVTDLRLGMTGRHPFRFAMAERDANGDWQAIEQVSREPMNRGDLSDLRELARRILDDDYPLPLARWARSLQQGRPAG